MSYVLTGCSDEMLTSMLAERRRQVKEVEWEIARRREERFGFPHWYCRVCDFSFRSTSNRCPVCGQIAAPFTQSTLTEHMAEIKNG